jgi:hypothetical protein
VFLPTTSGVVFIERRGLVRCARLVVPRPGLALGRTLITLAGYALYTGIAALVVKLVLAPFGGAQSRGLAGLAVVHVVTALMAVPSVVFLVAATLVGYAELRFREDRSVGVHTLAAAVSD